MPAHTGSRQLLLWLLLAALTLAASSCQHTPEGTGPANARFTAMPAKHTGVAFANTLDEAPAFNIINYLYYYNGGGVAVGDVNNDGLPDLYFTANLTGNRLYLNKGNLQFEEVTETAGVAGTIGWTTGTTMADVNQDGWLDIYVCHLGNYLNKTGANQLFINNGDGTFTDQAAAYGLDFKGFATQAAFFDADRDGDLDVYLLNHAVHTQHSYGKATLRNLPDPESGDRLYRNDGQPGSPAFTDITQQAGIFNSRIGYGLGVAVSDFNTDGWPDVYVSNDFHENDYLYLNNGDGTFTENVQAAMAHTSRFSMGNDAADVNNDALPDIITLDMQPADEYIFKTSVGDDPYDIYRFKLDFGYHYQFARNALQVNQGNGTFSDQGQMAGVGATDWSWAALFADLDHDGYQDLYITNGIYRRPNDLDYLKYISNQEIQNQLAQEGPNGGLNPANMGLLKQMPSVPISNYAFRNAGQATFTDSTAAWGLAQKGFSTGAAYADLDNDGDLDLVTNNINAPASIYRNNTDTTGGYLAIAFAPNAVQTPLGAKAYLYQNGQVQYRELYTTRGFQSAVPPTLHFGLGGLQADSLVVVWPNGRYQQLYSPQVNTRLTMQYQNAAGNWQPSMQNRPLPLLQNVTEKLGITYQHKENRFFDTNREPLMPHLLSTEGPAMALADVNADGLTDVFIGGARKQPAALLLQQANGTYQQQPGGPWNRHTEQEDVGAAFFDADADGDADLYVVSGGNEFFGNMDELKDRLYTNNGNGTFTFAEDALPDFEQNGSCVRPFDFDGDGDLDLFVGARVVAKNYGQSPKSYLLANNGQGQFTDVTNQLAPMLYNIGMVADAQWADVNNDNLTDLVLVGEWMPVTILLNKGSAFEESTEAAGLGKTHGWWNVLRAADFDGDGDIDFVAGNRGTNARFQASETEPVQLYINDFDNNGQIEQVLCRYNNGTSYPFASKDDLAMQLVEIKRKFTNYTDFGAATIESLFTAQQLSTATIKTAYTFESSYLRNQGNGTFAVVPLPLAAQKAPIYGVALADVDADNLPDLVLGGNLYGVDPEIGRYDASSGAVLRNTGNGFVAMGRQASGFTVPGQVRHIQTLTMPDGTLQLWVARNNNMPLVFQTSTALP